MKNNRDSKTPEYQQLIKDLQSKLTLISLEDTLEVESGSALDTVDGTVVGVVSRCIHQFKAGADVNCAGGRRQNELNR